MHWRPAACRERACASAKRGRTNAALSAIEGQRKSRAALADQRQHKGAALADLKAERAALGAKRRQIARDAIVGSTPINDDWWNHFVICFSRRTRKKTRSVNMKRASIGAINFAGSIAWPLSLPSIST
jgi:hypothetical protein